MKLPLTGGAYQSKSVIANCQSCINLFPENNQETNQPAEPVTHLITPGLRSLIQGGTYSGNRCTYRASNGNLYRVVGEGVYFVNSAFQETFLGSISSYATPVSMMDNGQVIVIVDGSSAGYAINMANNIFGHIISTSFYGSAAVGYLDGFFIFNRPDTDQFYISLANVSYAMLIGGTAFDPLDIAAKNGYGDNIVTLVVIQGYIWLIGSMTTEIWYNSGNALFTFERLPGVNIIQHGTVATYSVSSQDLFPYWLTQDAQGQAIIMKGKDYQLLRISTHAIEQEINTYSTISDCISFVYQIEGHTFIFFVFPTANKTWVYDEATGQWHQRCWTDNNGILNRHRANCVAHAYGKIVVGDWQNGNLYAFDTNIYTDNGQPISRIRSFPHIVKGSNRIAYSQFIADMAVGNDDGSIDGSTPSSPPVVFLRWSDDRGISYGNKIEQSLGAAGQYLTSIQFQRLGYARDRVFELSWSAPINTSLQGAWIKFEEAET